MTPEHDETAERIARLLLDNGYRFYSLEASRESAETPPQFIPREEVMAYVMQERTMEAHPNILAVLDSEDDPE
jgi:hypothetical protein